MWSICVDEVGAALPSFYPKVGHRKSLTDLVSFDHGFGNVSMNLPHGRPAAVAVAYVAVR